MLLDLYPHDEKLTCFQGEILIKQGCFKKALSVFKQLCKNNPKNADTYFKIGVIYNHTSDYPRAIKYFKQAIV